MHKRSCLMYCSPGIIWAIKSRRMRWARYVACMTTEMHVVILWGILEERDLLEHLGVRWENDIKMERKDMGLMDVDWIDVAGDWDKWRAVVNMVMYR
jgi:hypothetical protein